MVKLRIKNISGNINIKKDGWERFQIISQFAIGSLLVIFTALIYFQGLPEIERGIDEISEQLSISESVSVSVIRHRDSSIIDFDKKNLEEYKTTCYIENKGGTPEKYVIDELNFSTQHIAPHEKDPFSCDIKNGEIIKIF